MPRSGSLIILILLTKLYRPLPLLNNNVNVLTFFYLSRFGLSDHGAAALSSGWSRARLGMFLSAVGLGSYSGDLFVLPLVLLSERPVCFRSLPVWSRLSPGGLDQVVGSSRQNLVETTPEDYSLQEEFLIFMNGDSG